MNFDKSFMKEWGALTPLENRALQTLEQGMSIIFSHIPEKNIISIYLKGSFLRREMNKNSDVDVCVIVNNNKDLRILQELDSHYKHSMNPSFEFTGYSMAELKTGKFSSYGKPTRPGTDRFVRLIPSLRLIYGTELDLKELYQRTDLEHLQGLITTFHNVFFPMLEQNKMGFQDLLKQCLWLFELEVAVRNNKFRFTSWRELTSHFEGEHLIHKVLRLREINEKDKAIKQRFLVELKEYLEKLRQEFE